MDKRLLLNIIIVTFLFVFGFNMFVNPEFENIKGVFYGNVTNVVALDKGLIIKMLTVLVGETSILSGIFYYITKAIFKNYQ